MLLFISWLFALIGSELLLLQINSASIIIPVLYLSMGVMYLYQKNKIRNMVWLDENLKKRRTLNLKVLFLAALLIMLSIVAHINFAINSLLIVQWIKA
ncbi:TPA: hypothetical protein ACNP9N_000298 [Enterobacter asburiae]|jgi:hypothetical protein|uniref:hypothetical protein n=1 Tax=Enterobacter TaxID=547 RepID=UPI0003BE484B|nr:MULTISPECIES: hypothetical protein [Enterobacter]CAE7120243.1 hypothetical protein AI2694V1_3988 [Enterobacter cloacae]AKL02619.1 hypothetical protein AB190_19390 [Enterobacter asburiae]ELV3467925.1 hypothetical protein [Enterobacter asburiae]ESN17376.1 hypothetical protein L370_00728 [Enterobacter sp. MGH 24]MBL5839766.1 hypothetical protein [Enterobacter asburiae]